MHPKTNEELAYDSLKALILAGELPRGEFLSQRMLAQRVDGNITTVRTALRRLENDGLMENVPQWGVRIPEETEERLRDLYFMRELIEVAAVRRIVERKDSIAIKSIVEKARQCDELARKLPDNVIAFSQSHFDFHLELARQSGSELLVGSLNRINFRNGLLRNDRRLWTRRVLVNHEKLVGVILNSGVEVAIAEIQKHVKSGLQLELDELRKASAKSSKQ